MQTSLAARRASGAWAQQVHFSGFSSYSSDLVALRPDLSSPARGGIPVPCMGRQILHHWTTRGALPHPLLSFSMRPMCGRPSALTPSRPPALPPPPALPGSGPGRLERRVQPLEDLAIFHRNRQWRCRRRHQPRQRHGGVPGKEEVQKMPLDILCNVFALFPGRYLQTPAAEDKSSPEETPVRKLH